MFKLIYIDVAFEHGKINSISPRDIQLMKSDNQVHAKAAVVIVMQEGR